MHSRPMTIHNMSGFSDKTKNVVPQSPTHLLISRKMEWLSTGSLVVTWQSPTRPVLLNVSSQSWVKWTLLEGSSCLRFIESFRRMWVFCKSSFYWDLELSHSMKSETHHPFVPVHYSLVLLKTLASVLGTIHDRVLCFPQKKMRIGAPHGSSGGSLFRFLRIPNRILGFH